MIDVNEQFGAFTQRVVPSVALVLLLGGCATLPDGDPMPAVPESAVGVSVPFDSGLDGIAGVAVGDSISLDHEELGSGDFRIIDTYSAASGRVCTRIARTPGDDIRVVCRGDDGHWVPTRRLSGDATDAELSALTPSDVDDRAEPAIAAVHAARID